MSDILDLHTLSDPTDRHSLDELRAHPVPLADSGDVEPPEMRRTAWIMAHFDMATGKYDVTPPWQASERSDGDGR